MTTQLPQLQTTRNIRRGFGLIFLFLIIFVVVFSWASWRSEKQDEANHLSLLAELGGKSINAYISLVVSNLSVLNQEILDADGTLNRERVNLLLKRFKEKDLEIANVNIADLNGQILVSAVDTPSVPLPNINQKKSFILAREALLKGQACIISPPVFGKIVKEWVIPIRFGVRDQSGQLRYILNAPIALSTLQRFWHSLYLPPRARMGLLGDDGYLLSIYPNPKPANIKDIFGKIRTGALINELREKHFPQQGNVEGYTPVAHANFNFAYHRLSNHPITFFVASPVSNLQASWWKHNKYFYWLSLIFYTCCLASYYWILRRNTRWEAEKKLQEEKFRSIFEGSHDAIILLTEQKFFDCNQRTVDIFGMANKAEFLSFPTSGLSPPLQPDGQDSGAATNAHIMAAFKQGAVRFEWMCCRKSGEEFPVEVLLSAFDFAGQRVLQATVHDITQRKKTEAELLESEERFRRVVSEAPIPIIIHAEDGEVLEVNKVWTETTGYSRSDIPTTQIWTEKAYGIHAQRVQLKINPVSARVKVVVASFMQPTAE